MQRARLEAKKAANNLGMFLEERDELCENETDDNEHDKDDDDDDDEMDDPTCEEHPKDQASNDLQMLSDSESDNLTKDVLELEKVGVVDIKFVNNVKRMQESSLKCIHSSTIPMFELKERSMSTDKIQSKHSPFLEVKHNGKVVYVRKTTLVWIFQQAERVSTDRLFRVRNK